MSSSLSLYLNEDTAAAAAEAATEFDGGAPLVFLSVLHIHEQLKHDLRRSINPFRFADSWIAPQNSITNDATPVSLKRPCISVLGTAVLPLARFLSASKKIVQRLDVVKEVDDPVCVMAGSDGKLKLVERLKLFQHQASGSAAVALVQSFEPSFICIVHFCCRMLPLSLVVGASSGCVALQHERDDFSAVYPVFRFLIFVAVFLQTPRYSAGFSDGL